jgi:hypothetical protein
MTGRGEQQEHPQHRGHPKADHPDVQTGQPAHHLGTTTLNGQIEVRTSM